MNSRFLFRRVFSSACIAFALLQATGCVGAESDGAELGQPIVNGSVDFDSHAVVAILRNDTLWCTGTLIGPRVVVTAAHCFVGHGDVTEFDVGIGPVASSAERIDIVDGETHPQYRLSNVPGVGDVTENDIALVALAREATYRGRAVAPVTIGTLNGVAIGAALRLAGYGRVHALATGSAGFRMSTTASLGQVDASDFRYVVAAGVTCSGDSGGPSFLAQGGREVVVGATSVGDCVSSGTHTRLEAFLDSFIRPFVDANGGFGSPRDPGSQPPGPGDGGASAQSCSSAVNDVRVSCNGIGDLWSCTCERGGALVGSCTTDGETACSIPGGCCDAFF